MNELVSLITHHSSLITLPQVIFLTVTGVAAGLIGALFGIGGGILIVPVLALALKVPMHSAIATSLLCVIATSSAAASRNIRTGLANVRLASVLEFWTVIGAIVGSSIAGVLPGRTLMIIFGFAMALMSIPMARGVPDEIKPETGDEGDDRSFMASLRGAYHDRAASIEVSYRVRRLPVAMGVSTFAGVLSGLLGVGGGVLKVPVLSLWCDVPIKAAAATSNVIIGITATASAIIYWGRSEVAPVISAAAVIGVFAGSRWGARLAPRIHTVHLRLAFAMVMVIVAIQMLWRGLS